MENDDCHDYILQYHDICPIVILIVIMKYKMI